MPHARHHPAVDAAIARLSVEFAGNVESPTIGHVVVESLRDLSGAPAQAMSELVERLARQRIPVSGRGDRSPAVQTEALTLVSLLPPTGDT